jgi:hypothetical protein
MAEFSGFVAELAYGSGRTPLSDTGGSCRAVVVFVEMLDADPDPDGQRKEDQQNRKAKLERSPIGEDAGHIRDRGL